MINHCKAIGCTLTCDPKNLMCPEHWLQVSPEKQEEVRAHFHMKQVRGQAPSRQYVIFALEAIEQVALKEKKVFPPRVKRQLEHLRTT
jgi:hypothetical protein